MRVLGIDTATWAASVGVVDEERVLAERSLTVTGSHASAILPLIDDALAAAETTVSAIDLLAVSIGPGSFTGLRVALCVAKGLSLATGAAVVGVPTLEAHAHAVGRRAGLICPVLDARRREVYAAAFRWSDGEDPVPIVPVQAVTPRRLAQLIGEMGAPCTLVGEGVDVYGSLWAELLDGAATLIGAAALPPRGPVVARLGARRFRFAGGVDVGALEPLYVRRSEAELRREENRATCESSLEN